MLSRTAASNQKPVSTAEQAVKVLTFIEKTVGQMKSKIEKDNAVPTWLIGRINQLAVAVHLLVPYLQTPTPKKFEPSSQE
jgi:hypothetical protein